MNRASVGRLLGIWVLLLMLLVLTVASAYVPLGAANTIINLGVATAMAWLVMVFFMRLRTGSTSVRLVASAGLIWLALLLALSLADYLTRQPTRAPW